MVLKQTVSVHLAGMFVMVWMYGRWNCRIQSLHLWMVALCSTLCMTVVAVGHTAQTTPAEAVLMALLDVLIVDMVMTWEPSGQSATKAQVPVVSVNHFALMRAHRYRGRGVTSNQ